MVDQFGIVDVINITILASSSRHRRLNLRNKNSMVKRNKVLFQLDRKFWQHCGTTKEKKERKILIFEFTKAFSVFECCHNKMNFYINGGCFSNGMLVYILPQFFCYFQSFLLLWMPPAHRFREWYFFMFIHYFLTVIEATWPLAL